MESLTKTHMISGNKRNLTPAKKETNKYKLATYLIDEVVERVDSCRGNFLMPEVKNVHERQPRTC